jgi:hypothetical protein
VLVLVKGAETGVKGRFHTFTALAGGVNSSTMSNAKELADALTDLISYSEELLRTEHSHFDDALGRGMRNPGLVRIQAFQKRAQETLPGLIGHGHSILVAIEDLERQSAVWVEPDSHDRSLRGLLNRLGRTRDRPAPPGFRTNRDPQLTYLGVQRWSLYCAIPLKSWSKPVRSVALFVVALPGFRKIPRRLAVTIFMAGALGSALAGIYAGLLLWDRWFAAPPP